MITIDDSTITVLNGAAQAYPAMLAAIDSTEHSIDFANYCMISGAAFDRFHLALLAAAGRGVRVRLLVDAHGSRQQNPAQIAELLAAGVQLRRFQPFRLAHPLRYNHRLHKKLLVVDNAVGFTGGIGVGDYWLRPANYPTPWRDTHFELRGPIVAALAAGFASSWPEETGDTKPRRPAGASPHITPFDSRGGRPIATAFMDLITSAERSLTITTGYFYPSRELSHALIAAARRGVRVRILTNSRWSTHHSALIGGKHAYEPLLRTGIHIYEYWPTMIHAKLIIADGHTSCIGSANLSYRSLHHNQEFNLVIRNPELASRLEAMFEHDLDQARLITLTDWRRRPLAAKLLQAAASLGRYFY